MCFQPTNCGAGTITFYGTWRNYDPCTGQLVGGGTTSASINFNVANVQIVEPTKTVCVCDTTSYTLTNTCGDVTWEVSPNEPDGPHAFGSSVVAGRNCGTWTVIARSTINTNCTGSASLTVVKVVSLAPSEGDWVDDGDDDPDTDTYLIPQDCAAFAHWVALTATPCPTLAETNLPNCWAMTGGAVAQGSLGRLIRYVYTGAVGKTVVSVTADCSQKTVTIIVYKAQFSLYADEGDRTLWDVGHAWWSFSLQPDDAKGYINPVLLRKWIDQAGYWPVGALNYLGQAPGVVNLGDQGHVATGQHTWTITFWQLRAGLETVQDLDDSPGTFDFFSNNCTTKAIEIGDEFPEVPDYSGISTPWILSDRLKVEQYGPCD